MTFILFFLVLVFMAVLIIFSYYCFYKLYASVIGAPFAGIKPHKIGKMIKMAEIKPVDRVVDLGSGDGRILIEAAKIYPQAKYLGYEIDPFLIRKSRKKMRDMGFVGLINIKRKNYLKENLSSFDVVFLFLIPYQMNRLEKKLKKELKPGARVISYGFQFNHWSEVDHEGEIYKYQK
jgi:tRNA A58 N-methylase Trm61